ncbi:tetratricopeptide repeat protein [Mucilaginibacter terrae]|uniref:Tetratricopeptide (TPR) repeat protein n=1 Tax=Mucilaginibacter terrae TaxID=1955052 RepID=A0ABU3GSW5_9SPHI|nr:tetratricopeptide repeat protein [Mucilaginibacter terrae]MDT3402863.1 tetratricopeptide (TPR) repeat protein [Mucilaginibacter terrae]
MKNMISKVAATATGLVFIGSTVFAQSLADAKKAIDAEQYQKAKSMLKNLTATQATKDENFFYLGWVYLEQEYIDSAKATFDKGIAANPKSALNYAGLGAVARLNKDQAGAQSNFNQAITLAGKETKPYQYVGEGYLLGEPDGNAAIAVLQKGIAVSAKDPELYIALGDAYRTQLKNTDAVKAYQDALNINPKAASAKVATGVVWRQANNWEESEKEFKDALAIDPNYGPAYREWAETDIRWAQKVPAQASAKVNEAVEKYSKFLSLTDNSVESRLRYADFLYQAGKFKDLQTEATTLTQMPNANARAFRYLGYSAFENGDFATAKTAMANWMTKADPKRVIPYDYYYQGRILLSAKDTAAALQTFEKTVKLDTTMGDLYADIAKIYYAKRQFEKAGDNYAQYVSKSRKATLNDYFSEGFSYYFAYGDQLSSKATPKPTPDTALLTKADSAFSHIQQKLTTPNTTVTLYRARLYDLKEKDRNNIAGLAKPFYEKLIEVTTAKPSLVDADKKNLAESYAYLATLAEYKDKDIAKATELYTKAKENDPSNRLAADFFTRKAKGTKPAATKGKGK